MKKLLILTLLLILQSCTRVFYDKRDPNLIKSEKAHFINLENKFLVIPISGFGISNISDLDDKNTREVVLSGSNGNKISVKIYKNTGLKADDIAKNIVNKERHSCEGFFWWNPVLPQSQINSYYSYEFSFVCNSEKDKEFTKKNKTREARYIIVNSDNDIYEISYSKSEVGVFYERLMVKLITLVDMISTIRSTQICEKNNVSKKCREFVIFNKKQSDFLEKIKMK
jgi:hypothetical protein